MIIRGGRWARTKLTGVLAAVALLSSCAGTSATTGDGATSLDFAVSDLPVQLDIAKNYAAGVLEIMPQVTEPLEILSVTGRLTPNLAESVAEPDHTTIVYTLRKAVKFANGEPLTAKDVVWSIEHTFGPRAQQEGAQTASSITSLRSVTESGPDQVTVKLSHADPTARQNIALLVFVQQAAAAQRAGANLGTPGAEPVGTGPFQVSEFTPEKIKLSRNPNYWGNAPALSEIAFTTIRDESTSQLALRSGDVQAAEVTNLKNVGQWQGIPGVTLYAIPSIESQYLSLDTASPPLSDIHVRKAIAYAIDRQGISQAVYGSYGKLLAGVVPASILAGVAGSAELANSFMKGLPQNEFDLAKARSELARSAYPSGFTLNVTFPGGAGSWQELTILNLQQNMKKFGVTINPTPINQNEWSTNFYGHRNLGLQTVQAGSAPPDPNGLLTLIIGKQQAVANGFNSANFSTDVVEQALPVILTDTDKGRRWSAVQKVLGEIANQVPYIPLFTPDGVVVLGPGFKYDRTPEAMDWANGAWVNHIVPG